MAKFVRNGEGAGSALRRVDSNVRTSISNLNSYAGGKGAFVRIMKAEVIVVIAVIAEDQDRNTTTSVRVAQIIKGKAKQTVDFVGVIQTTFGQIGRHISQEENIGGNVEPRIATEIIAKALAPLKLCILPGGFGAGARGIECSPETIPIDAGESAVVRNEIIQLHSTIFV